jgi:hypothetical protein
LLAGIGMREAPEQAFSRDGYRMLVFVSEPRLFTVRNWQSQPQGGSAPQPCP